MEGSVRRFALIATFIVGAIFWGVLCFVAGAALRMCG